MSTYSNHEILIFFNEIKIFISEFWFIKDEIRGKNKYIVFLALPQVVQLWLQSRANCRRVSGMHYLLLMQADG